MRRFKHLGSVTTSEKVARLAILSCLPHNLRRWTSHSWNNVGSLPLTRGLSERQRQHWWVKLGSLSSSAKIPCYSHIVMMKQLVENYLHTNIFWLIWCKANHSLSHAIRLLPHHIAFFLQNWATHMNILWSYQSHLCVSFPHQPQRASELSFAE